MNDGKGESLIERNRITLAYLELAQNQLFKKMPEERRLEVIREALKIGEQAAEQIKQDYSSTDPRKIAVKMGLRVLGEEKRNLRRSEYRPEKKEIIISRKFHKRLINEVATAEVSENLLKLIVAHELFHHLEEERIGKVYKRFRFKAWKIGPYVREKFIHELSDVAAQAFTQTLLGLEISPRVFDYLTYLLYTRSK